MFRSHTAAYTTYLYIGSLACRRNPCKQSATQSIARGAIIAAIVATTVTTWEELKRNSIEIVLFRLCICSTSDVRNALSPANSERTERN